jgi:hypothetical protein
MSANEDTGKSSMTNAPNAEARTSREKRAGLKEPLAHPDCSSTCTSATTANTANYTFLNEPTCTWDISRVHRKS